MITLFSCILLTKLYFAKICIGSPTTGTLNQLGHAQITFWTYFGFKMANVTKGYDFRVLIILYTSIVKT